MELLNTKTSCLNELETCLQLSNSSRGDQFPTTKAAVEAKFDLCKVA